MHSITRNLATGRNSGLSLFSNKILIITAGDKTNLPTPLYLDDASIHSWAGRWRHHRPLHCEVQALLVREIHRMLRMVAGKSHSSD